MMIKIKSVAITIAIGASLLVLDSFLSFLLSFSHGYFIFKCEPPFAVFFALAILVYTLIVCFACLFIRRVFVIAIAFTE